MPVFFSIIIPTYNRANVLSNAINSIVKQTFAAWELIIVDDGSMDNTQELIAQINDTRIRYVYQENQERSVARNNGIKQANGQYICFLDSDDEYYLDYLELLYAEIQKANYPVSLIKSIPVIQFDNQPRKNFESDFVLNDNSVEHFLTTYSPLCAICCHHTILKEYTFDVKLKYAEDTNLWMRILSKYDLYNFKIHSCIIHISESDSKSQVNIHLAYINSFKKTFSIPEVKKRVSKQIVRDLIRKRFLWIRAEKRKTKDILGYIGFTLKLQLLKMGVI